MCMHARYMHARYMCAWYMCAWYMCVCATFGALYSQTALGLYLTTTLHIVLTQLIEVHNLTHILVV